MRIRTATFGMAIISLVAISPVAATPAVADPGAISYGVSTVRGNGCPQTSDVSVKGSGPAVEVNFNKMAAKAPNKPALFSEIHIYKRADAAAAPAKDPDEAPADGAGPGD